MACQKCKVYFGAPDILRETNGKAFDAKKSKFSSENYFSLFKFILKFHCIQMPLK